MIWLIALEVETKEKLNLVIFRAIFIPENKIRRIPGTLPNQVDTNSLN
jgi:hypothetical protein